LFTLQWATVEVFEFPAELELAPTSQTLPNLDAETEVDGFHPNIGGMLMQMAKSQTIMIFGVVLKLIQKPGYFVQQLNFLTSYNKQSLRKIFGDRNLTLSICSLKLFVEHTDLSFKLLNNFELFSKIVKTVSMVD